MHLQNQNEGIEMQQNPISSTRAESHGNSAIGAAVVKEYGKVEVFKLKEGDEIKNIKPKIRLLFDILLERRLVLYKSIDSSKAPLDDEFVLKDKDTLVFSEIRSINSSDSESSHTSSDVDNISSHRSSDEEKKLLLADDEWWPQQYFKKKFGLTKRFKKHF